VATACGGVSEVALYTIVGGCFRELLQAEPRARLWIDSRFTGDVIRPDFQVHLQGSSDEPLFAAEFKFLSDVGEANGHHGQVIPRIENDLNKLRKMALSNPKLETSAVVFFVNVGVPITITIEKKLSSLKFSCIGEVPLWQPKGVNFSAKLQIYVATDIDIKASKIMIDLPLEEL
jgi:hypothetical protein